ncbi:MAG: hypothetical protein IPH46_09645 [Bacteroidetes bacterium]|nr:hypothetical protein [Bacteroidota bacterium]
MACQTNLPNLIYISCHQRIQSTNNQCNQPFSKNQWDAFEYAIGEMTLISTDKNNQLIVTQGFYNQSLNSSQQALQ